MSPSHTRRRGQGLPLLRTREAIRRLRHLPDDERAGGRCRGGCARPGAEAAGRAGAGRADWAVAKRWGGRDHRARGHGPARRFATVWSELFPAEQARILQLLVERVEVQEDALEVRIRAEGLASLVAELRQQGERRGGMTQSAETRLEGNTLVVRIPMRSSAAAGASASWRRMAARLAPPLEAAARRHAGQGARAGAPMAAAAGGGRFGTLADLADAERISRSYVCRVLRLTLLAPDIVERILDGRPTAGSPSS